MILKELLYDYDSIGAENKQNHLIDLSRKSQDPPPYFLASNNTNDSASSLSTVSSYKLNARAYMEYYNSVEILNDLGAYASSRHSVLSEIDNEVNIIKSALGFGLLGSNNNNDSNTTTISRISDTVVGKKGTPRQKLLNSNKKNARK